MIQFVDPIKNVELLKTIDNRIQLYTKQKELYDAFCAFYKSKFEGKEINKRIDTALQKEPWANVKIKTGPDSEISLVRCYLSQDHLTSIVFMFYLPSDKEYKHREEMRIYLGTRDNWGNTLIKNSEELDKQNPWGPLIAERIRQLQASKDKVKEFVRVWNNALQILKEVNEAAEPLGLEYDFDIKTR